MRIFYSLLIFLCLMPNVAFLQESQAILSVKGEGKVFQLPDIMELSINISNKQMEYQLCVDRNLQDVDRLKNSLKGSNIPDLVIKDVGQRVNEAMRYTGGKSVPDGYRANYQLTLQIDVEPAIIHKLLEAMKNSEVAMNYTAGYKLSPELLKSLENRMIREAVADAKEKALVISLASDCKLLRIQKINYGVVNDVRGPIQFMGQRELKAKSAQSESFTNPDHIELTNQIEITYLISDQ